MIKNFQIMDSVGIEARGTYFDLHNDCTLTNIRIDLVARVVELEFTSMRGSVLAFGVLVLKFLEVDWVQVSPNVMTTHGEVDELGYKEAGDMNHDWLISEAQAPPDAHFVLALSDNGFVRLHSGSAVATVTSVRQ